MLSGLVFSILCLILRLPVASIVELFPVASLAVCLPSIDDSVSDSPCGYIASGSIYTDEFRIEPLHTLRYDPELHAGDGVVGSAIVGV